MREESGRVVRMSGNVIAAGGRFRAEGDEWEGRGEEVVATFATHGEAERAVEALANHGFPVDKAAIVARGLQVVEQVTGRSTSGRAALKGAAVGALAGTVVALAFATLLGPSYVGLGIALWGLVLGAGVGALVSSLSHLAGDEGPAFESVSLFRASTFDLVVTENGAEAGRIVDEAQVPDRGTESTSRRSS
jgi:hypothetical protein